jgi:hypothetical protein
MNTHFRAAMRAMAHQPDSRMAESWQWPGRSGVPLEGRDALYRSLEEEQIVLAHTPPRGEAEAILGLADQAFGDLFGLLIGLDDARLDDPPGNGEWPLRKVLEHMLLAERIVLLRAANALDHDEPLPRDLGLRLTAAELASGIDEWLDLIGAARTATRVFAELSDAQLERPSTWAGYQVDVRFSLHRFASHLIEHTIQCDKVLAALQYQPGEAGRIVRHICMMRGAHAARSSPETQAELDRAHLERARTLGTK